MKKLSLYLTLALAGLFMGSCSDDYTDWAQPQSNPQEDAITIPGFKATAVEAQTLSDDADSVKVFTLSTATLPDGFTLGNARVELIPQGLDGAAPTTVNTSLAGLSSKSDIQSLIESVYGKNPVARKFDAQVYVNAVKNGEAVLIDAGKIVYTVTTVTPDIAQAYYLIGGPNDWTSSAINRTLKFSHSETNVYDDPVFTITFPVADTTQDTWFAIGDDKACDGIANDDWSQVFGTKSGNGNNGTEGQLDRRANLSDAGSFMVPAGSKYIRVEINMMSYTYKVTAINYAEYIYEVGNNNSWGNGLAMFGPNFDGKYYGAFYLDGEFKFKPNSDNWEGDWEYNGEGMLDANGKDNIQAPATGHYFVTVDLGAMTYSLKPFTEMHIVGDAVGDWNVGKIMTWNSDNHTWVATGVTLGNGNIKFKDEDSNWAGVNLGGNLDKLVQNADNIAVTPGTYDIVLHMENGDRAPYAELIAETAK